MRLTRRLPRLSLERYADTPAAIFLTLLWIGVLGVLSMLPYGLKVRLGDTAHLHQAGHLAAFAVTTVLLLSLTKKVQRRVGVLLGVVTLAIASEVLQFLATPRRYAVFEWWDVRDDFAGIIAGLAIYGLHSARRNRERRHRLLLRPRARSGR